MRCKDLGRTLEFKLNDDFSVQCRYKYEKKDECYSLAMWLVDLENHTTCKIDMIEIDTQPLKKSTKDTIWKDIRNIVEYAFSIGFFNTYIERFNFVNECFSAGYDLLTKEETFDVE